MISSGGHRILTNSNRTTPQAGHRILTPCFSRTTTPRSYSCLQDNNTSQLLLPPEIEKCQLLQKGTPKHHTFHQHNNEKIFSDTEFSESWATEIKNEPKRTRSSTYWYLVKLVSQDVGLEKESGCGLGQRVVKKVARSVGTLASGAPCWPGA